jgi:hypothetical protein
LEHAYDNKKPGQQFIVYAKELKKIRISSTLELSKQYTCPYCGEYVRYIHSSKINPYFRHIRGSFIAKSCEKYVEGIGSYNNHLKSNFNQKLAGFPLYIRKFGDNFILYMGLFPVPEDIINSEIQNSQKIEIFNPNNAHLDNISLNDLIINEISFKHMEWLYESYSLKYANSKTSLFEYKWVSETPGIGSEGALFFCSDMYSRRIARNGKITPETNYYLVIPSIKKINNKTFLKIESINKLAVKAKELQKWSVYKIKFTEITNESSEFARDLHVTLVEKPKKLTPLWPPHIQCANKHIHKNECQSYYILQSNNSIKDTIFVKIVEGKELPIESTILNSNSALVKIGVTLKETGIPLEDGIDNFNTCTLSKPSFELSTYAPPTLQLQYANKDVLNSEELKLIKNSQLLCKSNYKCIFCHIRDNHLKSLYIDMLDFPEISDIKAGDSFVIIHGMDTIRTISFPIKKEVPSKILNKSDDQIYQNLIRQKGHSVPTPIILKYLLPNLSEYPKVKSYIQDSFRKGNIPKPAYDKIIILLYGVLSK